MNGKQAKLLRKGAGKNKHVQGLLKRAFKKLKREEKEKFLSQVRPIKYL